MKTKIALAISAALLTSTALADTGSKYNITNQKLSSLKGEQVNINPKNDEKKQASAWMIKLIAPSISQQTRTLKLDSKVAASAVKVSQDSVMRQLETLDANITVLDTTKILANAIIVDAQESDLAALNAMQGVEAVLPLYDFELHVAASAEYMKAAPLVAAGIASGKGQRVAILDTGIDYTHSVFGGSGERADYDAAVAGQADAVNWPQGKVLGGYDFVNNDPNPIDVSTNHGTHVSHSVVGIAPDVELYVYSVCGGGCSGLAQFRGLESAMDPNGDGNISDRVDTVNMSLGGSFGDIDGGGVQVLIDEMVELGVNLVISAGNDGPTPFIVGGPSTSNNALSVGAMTHPTGTGSNLTSSIAGEEITAYGSGFNTINDFSFDETVAPLVYPEANQDGCLEFGEDIDFTGKAVIIDRGACAFTTKVLSAQAKGAVFVLIANNADGDFFGPGGAAEGITIPSVGITKAIGDLLKEQITLDEQSYSIVSEGYSTVGGLASFTSRGPSLAGTLKPEITAPGTNILTAHPGNNALSPISGTSFSGPMTAGALSIIREAHPDRNAFEIKATVMNTADLDVTMEARGVNPESELAPISYIGAGLVDTEKAVNSSVAAWNSETNQAALAFGLLNISEPSSITKTLTVKNYSSEEKTYTLKATSRYSNDVDTGALSFEMPASVTIPPNGSINVDVTAVISPANLPEWSLHSAMIGDLSSGDNALPLTQAIQAASDELTRIEFDGSIDFMDGDDKALHVVYHMLPKATDSAEVKVVQTVNGPIHEITNTGSTTITEPFSASLIATDDIEEDKRHDLIAGSTELFANPGCDSGYAIFNTVQVRDNFLHTLPASYQVDFDIDNDGAWDFSSMTARQEWFSRSGITGLASFNRPYGQGSGSIGPAFHNAGNNFVTTATCSDNLGITAEMVASETVIKVRYRVEDISYSAVETGNGDTAIADLVLAPSTSLVQMISKDASPETVTTSSIFDADEEPVVIDSLAPGESAYLLINKDPNSKGVLILTDSGNLEVQLEEDNEESIPTVENAEFNVDKGTAPGTILGQVVATDEDQFTSPVSEFITISSSSNNVFVNKLGQVVVSDNADINQSTESMTITVKAVDTNGNVSKVAATITVNVNNTKPTVSLTELSVRDQQSTTITAIGADQDGDTLTYTWTQESGDPVSFEQNNESITFITPAGDNELDFTVVASDTRLESSASATVTVVGNNLPTVTLEDVSVRDLESVTLKAAATDADSDALTYTWTQTDDAKVEFAQTNDSISFVSPAGSHALKFSVSVSDGRNDVVATNTVTVAGNGVPTVTLADISVRDSESVTLKAVAIDADSDALTYVWTQTGGTEVEFAQTNDSISFVSPAGSHELKFTATVADGRSVVTASNTVTVAGNSLPTVTLEDVSVEEGKEVTLTASATDADDDQLTYTWKQTAGDTVDFTADAEGISFTAPAGANTYSFEVVANDGRGDSAAATSTVTVTAIPTPVTPPTPEPKKKKSGGSLGWLALLLTPLAMLRRRNR